MPEQSSIELSPGLLASLPESLRAFLSRGEKRIETADDDWEVSVRKPAPHLVKHLPPSAVLIGNNGIGDHLFLLPSANDQAQLDIRVNAYRHEGPKISVLAEDVASLVNPSPPKATERPPVCYHDGQTVVQLGDEVSARRFFRRRPGWVVYVPGISKWNREMEHGGLCWVAIQFINGGLAETVVDPETSRLKKSVHFAKRSAEPFGEFGPRERFE